MPEEFVQIARDPFARQDLIRRTEASRAGCAECGQNRHSGKLFRYGCWPDAGHVSWQSRLFCSVTCMRSYTT